MMYNIALKLGSQYIIIMIQGSCIALCQAENLGWKSQEMRLLIPQINHMFA